MVEKKGDHVPDREVDGEDLQNQDAPITEEALTAVLKDEGMDDETPLSAASHASTDHSDSTSVHPDNGKSGSSPLREGVPEQKGTEPGLESEPTPPSQDMEAVFETVHQLQTLDTLLRKLNFRELILQFGQLQADLEVLHEGVQHLRKMVDEGETLLACVIGNGEPVEGTGIPLSKLNSRLEHLQRTLSVVLNRMLLERKVQGEERDRWLGQMQKAMDAMTRLHEIHRTRMEMIEALNRQVDSPDVSNQQLASAALEFAVYMRELESTPSGAAFEEAFAELEVLRETLDAMKDQPDPTADLPEPEVLEDVMRFLGDLPDLVGEMSALLSNLSSELGGLAEGVRAARPETFAPSSSEILAAK